MNRLLDLVLAVSGYEGAEELESQAAEAVQDGLRRVVFAVLISALFRVNGIFELPVERFLPLEVGPFLPGQRPDVCLAGEFDRAHLMDLIILRPPHREEGQIHGAPAHVGYQKSVARVERAEGPDAGGGFVNRVRLEVESGGLMQYRIHLVE